MTEEELNAIGDGACVSVAASHDSIWMMNDQRLEPRLWEALRVEFQRRYRRSTGEEMAVLTIQLTPPPQVNVMCTLRKIADEPIMEEPFKNHNRVMARDEMIKLARAALAAMEGSADASA